MPSVWPAVALLTAGVALVAVGEALRRWDARCCLFANTTGDDQ